jgi:hypothetical protein
VVRDPAVRDNRQYYGPAPEENCPCGSRRQARRCHRATDDSWVAECPGPLLTGPRTGYANPSCYAKSANDCSKDLTREHWLSADLLKAISHDDKLVAVTGAAWQGPQAKQKSYGVNALSSKMLCGRHNNALSPLDAMASKFFVHLREDQLDLMTHMGSDDVRRAFTLVSGPRMELWVLKVLWGAIKGCAIRVGGTVAYRFRLGVTDEILTEILWRGADWPSDWGWYFFRDDVDIDQAVTTNSASIRMVDEGSEIRGGFVQLAGIEFGIAFELPPVTHTYRPAAFTFDRVGLRGWKMFAFAWPKLGHRPENFHSQQPPNANPHVPPNPQAAKKVGPQPGSVQVTADPRPPSKSTKKP